MEFAALDCHAGCYRAGGSSSYQRRNSAIESNSGGLFFGRSRVFLAEGAARVRLYATARSSDGCFCYRGLVSPVRMAVAVHRALSSCLEKERGSLHGSHRSLSVRSLWKLHYLAPCHKRLFTERTI